VLERRIDEDARSFGRGVADAGICAGNGDGEDRNGGVVFFTYLQKERSDLLDFHAVGGDKWATVHGWLYYTGRVKD
jgi:hypothetical protein